jgi:hypothetical protein
MMLIKIPAGHVLFIGGWRKWMPILVVWFTANPSIEIRLTKGAPHNNHK